MTVQRDAAWVLAASPEERVKALNAGELVHYMGGQTAEERAQVDYVRDTPDRLYAQAHGFSTFEQMKAVTSAHGSTLVDSIRRDMSSEQLEKLNWLGSASPAEVFAAEQAGELDQLLGRGRFAGANQADGNIRSAGGAASGSRLSEVEASAEFRGMTGQA